MTAIGDLLNRETKARLLQRLEVGDERELDRLAPFADMMRQVPDQLGPPVPRPLHSMARDRTTERTTSS